MSLIQRLCVATIMFKLNIKYTPRPPLPSPKHTQNVKPFFVATAMSGIRRANFLVPSPEAMAKAAVATIGIQEDTFGCFSHALQVKCLLL